MELLSRQIHGETLHQIFQQAMDRVTFSYIATEKIGGASLDCRVLKTKKPDLRFAFHDIPTDMIDMYLNHPKSIFDLGVYLHTSYIHL